MQRGGPAPTAWGVRSVERSTVITEVLTKGIGELNLRDIEVYRTTGGYVQLERAVKELGQKAVMDLATARTCAVAAARVSPPA